MPGMRDWVSSRIDPPMGTAWADHHPVMIQDHGVLEDVHESNRGLEAPLGVAVVTWSGVVSSTITAR